MSKFAEAYAKVLQENIERKRRMRRAFWMVLCTLFVGLFAVAITYSRRHAAELCPWNIIADTADEMSPGYHLVQSPVFERGNLFKDSSYWRGTRIITRIDCTLHTKTTVKSHFGPVYDHGNRSDIVIESRQFGTEFTIPWYADTSGGILRGHFHLSPDGDGVYDSLGRLLRVDRGRCTLTEIVWDHGKWVPYLESFHFKADYQ